MSYQTIHTLLDTQLQTVVNLPTLQIENTRKAGSKTIKEWTRSTLIPSRTTIETLGPLGYNKKQGLYQIDVFYPEDTNYNDTFLMSDTIIEKFTIGTNLSGVHIINSYMIPSQTTSGSIAVPGYFKTIVMVEWEYFETRLPL